MTDENKDFDGIRYRVETGSPLLFRIVFTLLIVWGAGFTGYYLFSGWSSEQEFARNRQAKEQRVSAVPFNSDNTSTAGTRRGDKMENYLAIGKKEFSERCSACHGAEARGGIGPDLTRKDFKYGRTEAALAETIAEGRPGGMPSFKADLSREKIESLVKYLLSL